MQQHLNELPDVPPRKYFVWDLRSSHQCCKPFWEVIPRCLVNSPLGIPDPENKGIILIRNVGNHLPTNTTLHLRRYESTKINFYYS